MAAVMNIEEQKALALLRNENELYELLKDAQDCTRIDVKAQEENKAHYSDDLHTRLLVEGYPEKLLERVLRDSKSVIF